MFGPRYLPGLLIAVLACSDTPAQPRYSAPFPEPDDGYRMIKGYVVSPTQLRAEDGSMVPLLGPQTELLTELIGAEIRIRGVLDEIGSTTLWIVEFRVLYVDNLPALDGKLARTESGFGINSSEGTLFMIRDVPAELAAHVGKRVWLTMLDGAPVRYGVLEK